MEQAHDLRELGAVEVLGADPGIVTLKTEVNGIGPVLDRGDHAGPIARRCEQLGLDACARAVYLRRPTKRVRSQAGLGDGLLRLNHGTAFNREVIARGNARRPN